MSYDHLLSDEHKAAVSLMRIIAVLVARTGETRVEIGEIELNMLPELPPLKTWPNPAAFSHFVEVALPAATVELIRQHGATLRDDVDDIVDAEIVEDAELTTGQRALEA